MNKRLRVLNLYAGLGGNSKKWADCDVVAVELDPKIAAMYKKLNPSHNVIVGDAHQYLLDHYEEFDFIWCSPMCPTHSRMALATRHKLNRYPDMSLYQEIIFLKYFFKGHYVVENVFPFYKPLIEPTTTVGRHVFWSSFKFKADEIKQPKNFINQATVSGKKLLQNWLGIHYEENIYYGKNHCPAQILRNCVHPDLGLQIFNQIPESTNEV